ncbi:hypothetical protein BJX63DRAFT_438751 [Aspergillus granulosus]|uniref:Hydrophobin n=1 Tax=Aspergillus granulosus TaxID=176169 RepID=A0ABR4GRI4_9EURO
MQFTLATFVTLIAAVVALPPQNNVHQKRNNQNLDALQAKCGDQEVNCCVVAESDDHSDNGFALFNLLHQDWSEPTYCSPTYENSVMPAGLSLLLGLEADQRFCDVPSVTYACCSGSDCTEIGGAH